MKSTLFTRNIPLIRLLTKSAMIIVLICAFATVALARNGNPNPGILPIESSLYSKYAAAWWKWAMEIPASQNPLLDQTGEFADVNQIGHIWFLAGNFGGTTVRECTVPIGKSIFFPIVNGFIGLLPCETWEMYGMEGLEDAREYLASVIDGATDVSCEIDGKPVNDIMLYREQSPVFSFVLPEDNVFGVPSDYCGSGVKLLCDPTVDEGIYLMLNPLSRGKHTIHFQGKLEDIGLELDVTYYLTVR